MRKSIKVIKVSNIRQEKEYIAALFPEFKLISQVADYVVIKGEKIPVDILKVKTRKGIKIFYFDIRKIYAKYDAALSTDAFVDFKELLLDSVLGMNNHKEKNSWMQKVRDRYSEPPITSAHSAGQRVVQWQLSGFTKVVLFLIVIIICCAWVEAM